MSTTNGTVNHSITLATSGAYTSPLTITATGSISNNGTGISIYGPAAGAWSVANLGTVTAIGTFAAIDFANGGLITNGSQSTSGSVALIQGGGGLAGVSGGNNGGDGIGAANAISITGASGSIANYATVIGGAGGIGGDTHHFVTGQGGGGGAGGAGISLMATGFIDNTGLLAGGAGGAGGYGIGGGGLGKSGGEGGSAIHLSAGGTIVNSGTIFGGAGGAGGTGGSVAGGWGGYAIQVQGGAGSISNTGVILGGDGGNGAPPIFSGRGYGAGGHGNDGISLADGGIVRNFGTIIGGAGGVNGQGITFGGAGIVLSDGIVANYGTIVGSSRYPGGRGDITYGIQLGSGTVINKGFISAVRAVVSTGTAAATVINYGTIAGIPSIFAPDGTAISFVPGSYSTLIEEAGSQIVGDIKFARVEFGGAGGPGTISNLGNQGAYSGITSYTVLAGANWTLTGSTQIQNSQLFINGTLVNDGTITGTGELVDSGTLLNAGNITANAIYTPQGAIGVVTNTGVLRSSSSQHGVYLGGGGGITFVNFGTIGGTGGGPALSFGAGRDFLVIEPGSTISGAVTNFYRGATIDFAGVQANGDTYSNGVLSLQNNGVTVATLELKGDFNSSSFALSPDGASGTNVTLSDPVRISGTINHSITLTTTAAYTSPLTITSTGSVSNTYNGPTIYGPGGYPGTWAVYNQGRVSEIGNFDAIVLKSAGDVVNTGTITAGPQPGTGGVGVYLSGYGTIVNQGFIAGGGGFDGTTQLPRGVDGAPGIILSAGGTLSNTGIVVGGDGGNGSLVYHNKYDYYVAPSGVSGNGAVLVGQVTVSNLGTIAGGGTPGIRSGYGIELTGGGLIVNGNSANQTALIGGSTGIAQSGAAATTVVNYGVISGITFSNSSGVLIIEGGSQISGAVQGDGGTLELAAGGGADTLFGEYAGFSRVAVLAGAQWGYTGYHSVAVGAFLTNAGTLANMGTLVNSGMLINSGTLINDGTIIGAAGTALSFSGGGDRLVIDPGSTLTGAIGNLQTNDIIDIVGTQANGVAYINGTLTLENNGSPVYSLTVPGSFTSANFRLSSDGGAGTDITVQSVAPNDFNGDGTSDILWQHSSGAVADWLINNAQVTSSLGIGSAGGAWSVVGTGDFDGDGTSDILWHDSASGTAALWKMQNGQVKASLGVASASTNWHIVTTGDFNRDGTSDMVWRDANSGTLALWEMNGASVTASLGIGSVASEWTVFGSGDFNADGKSDLLWRDTNTGTVAIWEMNGAQVQASIGLGDVGLNWSIQGIGDFNGDGTSDLLWQDSNSGTIAIWEMQNGQVTASLGVGSVASNWQIVGTGDYNHDGKSDILFRDSNSGTAAVWEMNGANVLSSVGVGSAASDWSIVHPNPLNAMNV